MEATIDYSDSLTVFLVSSGEKSRDDARARIMAQDCNFQFEEIADVSPMNAAFQKMLDCDTEWFVQVDADMLLEHYAIRWLYGHAQYLEDNIAIFVGWLWGDAEERPIQGVKIYRTEVVKKYPFVDEYSCEMSQVKALERDGYKVVAEGLPDDESGCYGLHYSLQTPERAYRRWRRLVQKHRRYEWMSWIAPYPAKLLAKSEREPSDVNLAASLGALSGLVSPLDDDQEDRASESPPGYKRVSAYLTPGPSELVVYATDRCNHKCPFCDRTMRAIEGGPDIPPQLVSDTLTAHPTIKSVCIAGFGEPLLHGRIRELQDVCFNRGRSVGLITNGALLGKMLPALDVVRLSYLSVSLNATTKEEHQKATGVDTWGRVIAGIETARARGLNVGVSYVCTRQNLDRLPDLFKLAYSKNACFVNLVGLLPHGGNNDAFWESALVDCDEVNEQLERAKEAEYSDIVQVWPVVISSRDAEPPRACTSPTRIIGIDARGYVTGCRRVKGPEQKNGSIRWPDIWHGKYFVNLRRSMLGDRELNDECRACWACWKDY